ncbi:universal stress protein [Methylobacterium sp. Leaf89]|uniref:universal stress protein n=1 Tax=Methylobacterium sp. Leaf89 TaxID=1736245 RepID=UPI0006FEEC72|nr:universal stress protein [Methylobacterium sp. Leaf89]KQO74812.1 universal stress protein UspA [Methylobacterium sp. Leaf89]
MTISNIMVSVDLGAAASDRVRLTAGLAERFGSKLTGVAGRPVLGPIPIGDVLQAERAWAAEERSAEEDLAAAQALFAREAAAAQSRAWRSVTGSPLAYLAAQARSADLVVVGRQGPGDGDPGVMAVSVGPLLMEVGRPVLLTPPGLAHLAAKRIVVAWKDTREARRAVHDALPLLARADKVHIAVVGPAADQEGAEDAAAYLSGHGVTVTTHLLRSPEINPAEEILRFARREEADLVVMGAYGRSRLREWIFGGVTRDIIQTTPLCCLMSH